ncbi:MAG: DUF3987 domain-containing protein [Deltaproteobacteria bacterium]|nr:DUF3987 domain-containing protein [Deltaproteobacteria bacterium]
MFSNQLSESIPPPIKLDHLKEKMNHIRGKVVGSESLKNQAVILNAALDYAGRAFPVIPLYSVDSNGICTCGRICHSPGKHPMTRNGLKDASSCPSQINVWFNQAVANLGIITGISSGLVVIDLDCYRGSSLADFYSRFEDLSPTLTVQTGGGYHLYLNHPGFEVSNRAKILPGVDVRADGGYIVAPPSRHASGKIYRWDNDLPIQDCPPSLLEMLQVSKGNKKKVEPEKAVASRNAGAFKEGVRNDSLTTVAGFLRSLGLSAQEIQTGLLAVNQSLCFPPLKNQEVFKIATSVAKYDAPLKWTTPKDLPEPLTVVPSLTAELLPERIAPALIDISERMQVPLEFVAGPAIVAAASVIGRKVKIKPLKNDDWTVVPNLWGMIIAEPGSMKSPALAEALRPLENLVRRARDLHSRTMCDFEQHKAELEIKITSLKENMKKTTKNSFAVESELNSLITTHRNLKKPIERRYKTNDPTTEKLATLMAENPQGLLLFRDELSGWIERMTRHGQRGDKEFYLETWSGDSAYTVDRIERGTTYVDPLCLSVFGGIQPAKLKKYLQWYERYAGHDGFLERFQVTFMPEARDHWTFIDRAPDLKARVLFEAVFDELDKIPIGEAQIFQFSPNAQALADEWRKDLEQENHKKGIHPVLRGHFSKYRSLMPSLALVNELLDKAEADHLVSEKSVSQAIGWCSILKTHAYKLYSILVEQKIGAAHVLAERIKAGRFVDGMKLRDVARKNWPLLRSSDQIEDACEVLESCNWLRVDRRKVPGGNSGFVYLNPHIIKQQKGASHES